MSANIEKDCIRRPDGSLLCWDKNAGKLYEIAKREVAFDAVSKEDLVALMTQTNHANGECYKSAVITQSDLQNLFKLS